MVEGYLSIFWVLAIMRARYGETAGGSLQATAYGEAVRINDVTVTLVPAGHVLGSAQAVLDYRGSRVVVSGDYKRRRDPTCAPFEVRSCDVFITEATFGLPVFRHPPDRHEIDRLLHSLHLFPESCHLVGVYALGKCQRVIGLLREAGYDEPIYIHGALAALCEDGWLIVHPANNFSSGSRSPRSTARSTSTQSMFRAPARTRACRLIDCAANTPRHASKAGSRRIRSR